MAIKSFSITTSRFRIRSAWIREILSEIFATYVFVLLAIGVVAQEVMSGVGPATGMVINLSISLALTMAIYVSGNASGGYVNPGIALSMCLTGYLKWRKFPVFVLCYFVGAFLASATVYAVYYDDINMLDGGERRVSGVNGTGFMFTSYPSNPNLSKGTAFVEILTAHTLLVICTLALADERNMAPCKGMVPIPVGLSVFTICTGFSHNTGCPINATKDLAPRFMLLAAGYGPEALTYMDYWIWVPPVAGIFGSVLGTWLYQLIIGLQWEPLKASKNGDLTLDEKTLMQHGFVLRTPPFCTTESDRIMENRDALFGRRNLGLGSQTPNNQHFTNVI